MKTAPNMPKQSKINYTALIMALVGILVGLDIIPPEIEEPVIQVTLIGGPALIAVFRTWFT
jgi:hypothetical protein|tara:strand:+ start:510 stop:692 length:183 start_codon:yes stop_codon:yes gene_type:complete